MSILVSALSCLSQAFKFLHTFSQSSYSVNCFFCNSDLVFNKIDPETKKKFNPNSFACRNCGSQNVRDSSGDIVDSLPQMFDENLNRSPVLVLRNRPHKKSPRQINHSAVPYCDSCLTSRELNLKALAEYDPTRTYSEYGFQKLSPSEFKLTIDTKYPLSCSICSFRNRNLLHGVGQKFGECYKTARGLFNKKNDESKTDVQLSRNMLIFRFLLDAAFFLNFLFWFIGFSGFFFYNYISSIGFESHILDSKKVATDVLLLLYDPHFLSKLPNLNQFSYLLFSFGLSLIYCPPHLQYLRSPVEVQDRTLLLTHKFKAHRSKLWAHRFSHFLLLGVFLFAENYYDISNVLEKELFCFTELRLPFPIVTLLLFFDLSFLFFQELKFIYTCYILYVEANEIACEAFSDRPFSPKVASFAEDLERQANNNPTDGLTALFTLISLNDY